MQTMMLRPGILVALKTALDGGVAYARRDLPADVPENGADVAKWETTRTIEDAAEHARAVKVRSEVSSCIRSACAWSTFGLLCAESNETRLDTAIAQAQELVCRFNESASTIQIRVYVLKGRIASTDQEATRAIASDVASLLSDMERGIRGADVETIRAAANRARQLGAILDDETGRRVSEAVDAARTAARAIVKRIDKGGEDAARVLAELSDETAAVQTARFAFLDLTEQAPAADYALPAVNVQRAAELEV